MTKKYRMRKPYRFMVKVVVSEDYQGVGYEEIQKRYYTNREDAQEYFGFKKSDFIIYNRPALVVLYSYNFTILDKYQNR